MGLEGGQPERPDEDQIKMTTEGGRDLTKVGEDVQEEIPFLHPQIDLYLLLLSPPLLALLMMTILVEFVLPQRRVLTKWSER